MKPRGKGVCYRNGCSDEAQYWVRWRNYPEQERACPQHARVAKHSAHVLPIDGNKT